MHLLAEIALDLQLLRLSRRGLPAELAQVPRLALPLLAAVGFLQAAEEAVVPVRDRDPRD